MPARRVSVLDLALAPLRPITSDSRARWVDGVEFELDLVHHEGQARHGAHRISQGVIAFVGDDEALDRLRG